MKPLIARLLSSIAFILCASLLGARTRADEPTPLTPAPLFGVAGECLLQTDFAAAPLDDSWHAIKGKWEVKDGALRAEQIPAQNHAAVLRREMALHDFIATFVFRFDGGKAIKLVVNNNNGHVFAVSIWPNEMDIFKQPEKNKTFAQKTGTLDAMKVDLKKDQWHTAIVEVIGKTVVASVDGTNVIRGSHEGIDIDKTAIDFAANASATIKAIKFCRASVPADVEAAQKKVDALRGNSAGTQPAK